MRGFEQRLAPAWIAVFALIASCDCSDDSFLGDPDASDTEAEHGDPGTDPGDEEVEDEVDPLCGNGIVEDGEACDDGPANSDVEPDACREGCVLPGCGDGVIDSGEGCDGEETGGATCEGLGLGFTGGVLRCDADCLTDTSLCSVCGNGLVEMHEDCEEGDLGGATCESLGMEGSGLACGADCLFDTSGCGWCGNGVVDGDEACDDGNFILWDGCNDCDLAEFVVNPWVGGGQVDPAVALSADGDMVVAWFEGTDRFGSSTRYVLARTYLADGTVSASEWRASVSPGEEPEVEIDGSGRVIVVYDGLPTLPPPETDGCNYLSFHDPDGSLLGDEIQVCLACDEVIHEGSDLESAGDGSFVVAWTRGYRTGFWTWSYNAVVQWFDPEGERIGEIVPLQGIEEDSSRATVAAAPDGRSVVVWFASEDDLVHGALFGPGGSPVSGSFPVTENPSFIPEGGLAVDMGASGDFTVVWSDGSSSLDEIRHILGRSFDASGIPLGPAFDVGETTEYSQERVDVGVLPDGRRIVVWESVGQDGDGWGVYGRLVGPDDVPLDHEFRVNDLTVGHQFDPDIDVGPSGHFAVVWSGDYGGYTDPDVFAQRFDDAATPLGLMAW